MGNMSSLMMIVTVLLALAYAFRKMTSEHSAEVALARSGPPASTASEASRGPICVCEVEERERVLR